MHAFIQSFCHLIDIKPTNQEALWHTLGWKMTASKNSLPFILILLEMMRFQKMLSSYLPSTCFSKASFKPRFDITSLGKPSWTASSQL